MKSEAYRRGWLEMIIKLRTLRYKVDQDLAVEFIHYNVSKLLMNIDLYRDIANRDYCEGVLAIIELFEKTGIIPEV